MTVISSPENTQYITGWLEFVFKWILRLRNYHHSEFHSWNQLVCLERIFSFDKKKGVKEFLQGFLSFFFFFNVWSWKQICNTVLSSWTLDYLAKEMAAKLSSILYLKTFFKKTKLKLGEGREGGGRGFIWLTLHVR